MAPLRSEGWNALEANPHISARRFMLQLPQPHSHLNHALQKRTPAINPRKPYAALTLDTSHHALISHSKTYSALRSSASPSAINSTFLSDEVHATSKLTLSQDRHIELYNPFKAGYRTPHTTCLLAQPNIPQPNPNRADQWGDRYPPSPICPMVHNRVKWTKKHPTHQLPEGLEASTSATTPHTSLSLWLAFAINVSTHVCCMHIISPYTSLKIRQIHVSSLIVDHVSFNMFWWRLNCSKEHVIYSRMTKGYFCLDSESWLILSQYQLQIASDTKLPFPHSLSYTIIVIKRDWKSDL
jgi:hypothetical protein